MERILFIAALASFSLSASDWPQWRGPSGQGQSEDRDLPLKWGQNDENVLWKSPLPKSDTSQSSPIVSRGKVFVMSAQNKPLEQHVTCFDKLTGKQLWDKVVPPGPWLLTDLRGGYSCSTPCSDGEHIYVFFGSSILAALDFEGNIVWTKNVEPFAFDVAIAASPIIYKDNIILLCDQTNKKSFIAAYDRKTGEQKWSEARPANGYNHSTPLLAEVSGKPQLFIGALNQFQGVDPENGKLIWWVKAVGDVGTPVYGSGLAYMNDGRGKPGVCVDPKGTGDITATNIKWTLQGKTNGMNSPIIVGDFLYHISASLRCFKLATGEEVWSQRLGGDFNPSPFSTPDRRIYYASAGKSWVVKAGDKFELLGESDLGDPSSSSPAVSDGKIYLKGAKQLYCIGKK